MWNIHGKTYDLTEFIDNHPGGKLILQQCKGTKDSTAAFESYHALSDMKKIKSIMKRYEVSAQASQSATFNFKDNAFYMTLSGKVRDHFRNSNTTHHADHAWVMKTLLQFVMFLVFFIPSFYCMWLCTVHRVIFAFISGNLFIQLGFCVMHDASHHAISPSSRTNESLSFIWNSLALWDNSTWYKHHCFMHHSFTGTKLDPDIIHLNPAVQKSSLECGKKYFNYTDIGTLFFTCIFPGMWLGQSIAYYRGIINGHLWRMELPNYEISYCDIILKCFTLFSLLFSGSFAVSCSFIIACNTTYFACILPDHDTYETHANIAHDSNMIDWGELQVRNSANFATTNPMINYCFGGINYQIEHHLFPTVCHIHFPELSKIVKETCKEFKIPYVEHETMFTAICSVLRNFKDISINNRSETKKMQ